MTEVWVNELRPINRRGGLRCLLLLGDECENGLVAEWLVSMWRRGSRVRSLAFAYEDLDDSEVSSLTDSLLADARLGGLELLTLRELARSHLRAETPDAVVVVAGETELLTDPVLRRWLRWVELCKIPCARMNR